MTGADAVLVTHEHADHVDVLRLAGLGVPVYAPVEANIPRVDVIGVPSGGNSPPPASAYGRSAVVTRPSTRAYSDCANLGYIIDEAVYHPGDSLHVPDQPIETLLVPVQGSWMKTAEAIDFVKAVEPQRAFALHDAQINDRGLSSVNGWLAEETNGCYRYLRPGESA